MSKQHTPTPYKFVKTNAGIRYIVACDDNIIATISSQADGIDNNAKDAEADATAKLFVTACNSHDRLEEVNRELVEAAKKLTGRIKDCWGEALPSFRTYCEGLDKVIAKAEQQA